MNNLNNTVLLGNQIQMIAYLFSFLNPKYPI